MYCMTACHSCAIKPVLLPSYTDKLAIVRLNNIPVGNRVLYDAGSSGFLACAALYAVGSACIGASPMAYATDVMPANLGGFGLGMYRCAGDLGETTYLLRKIICILVATCTVQRYSVKRTAISIVSGSAYNYRGCSMTRHDMGTCRFDAWAHASWMDCRCHLSQSGTTCECSVADFDNDVLWSCCS